ncbi:MAG: pilus (MSHA type) biogenesis protein MshL [Pseudomonadota bacterium]
MKILHQMINIIYVLLLCSIFLPVCASVTDNSSYAGEHTMHDVETILSKSEKQNEQLEKLHATNVPQDVSDALLPALSVQKPIQGEKSEARFNIAVKNISARDFFLGLVKGTKYNMVVSPKIEGDISLNLNNVTIPDVLDAVQQNYGYQYDKTSYGYQIYPPQLETRTFTVNYLDIDRKGESNVLVSSGQMSQKVSGSGTAASSTTNSVAPTSKISTTSESDFWKTLTATLTLLVGDKDGHQVIVNSDAGLVIVKAYPNEFASVAHYLDSLQANMSQQVILEAKILEVQLKSGYKAGIDWTVLGVSQTGRSALSTDLTAITRKIFTLDMHFGNAFSTIIDLLSTQGNVQTLSNPRISTMNNQMAVIKVGSDEFFVTDVSSTTTGSGSDATTSQNLTLTPFFSGISLDVTPQISTNGDVTLHIHPVISAVTDQTKTFTVSGKPQSLPLALSKIRESDDVVHAKNGQIIVIGGLMENKSSEEKGNTPFLSNLPVIGSLFKRTDQSFDKTELVILLRPVVVQNNTWSEQINDAAQKFKSMDRAFESVDDPKISGAKGRPRW